MTWGCYWYRDEWDQIIQKYEMAHQYELFCQQSRQLPQRPLDMRSRRVDRIKRSRGRWHKVASVKEKSIVTHPFLLQSMINLNTPCRSGTRKLTLYQPFLPFTGKTVVRTCGSNIVNSSCRSSSGVPAWVGASSTHSPRAGSQVTTWISNVTCVRYKVACARWINIVSVPIEMWK